jgi:site-specific recombinase XerD
MPFLTPVSPTFDPNPTPAAPPTPTLADVTSRDGLLTLFATVLANCDVKPTTRDTYRRAFPNFASWFAVHDERHDPATLIRYKTWLTEQTQLAAASKSLYLNAARLLYRRLFELGALDRNYAASIRGFAQSAKHKRAPISDTQLDHLFAYLNERRDPRLLVIFNLLYRQGLRRHEVVSLRVADIDLVAMQLMVLGKARDDREAVPLHPATIDAITRYLEASNLRDGFLFPSRKHKAAPLTTTRLYQMVTSVHRTLHMTTNVHAYRKAFTSKLIDSGMNLLTVQQFTRHRSLDMLKVYYDRIDQQKAMPTFVEALR